MPQVQCKICKSSFYAKPSWLKKGWGKLCSIKCRNEGQKKGRIIKCSTCNKNTYKSPRALKNSRNKKYFCNKSCQTIWRNSVLYTKENHPNWKGGTRAYKAIILRSGKKQICRRCNINDIRVLVVHHLDENRKNNKLNNLVWLCHNCHHLVHRDKNEKEKFMVGVA